jgi:hypothetical protein
MELSVSPLEHLASSEPLPAGVRYIRHGRENSRRGDIFSFRSWFP